MDTRQGRILVVDDTKANLDVLCELLEGEGYSVSLAPNGEIALRIASRTVPDLILLDVMMPGINGFEVCRQLKERPLTAHVPVIFITAEDNTESVLSGFEAGGIDYIKKPFNDREVLARVQTHLQIDRLTRELSEKNRALEAANESIQAVSDRKSQFVAHLSHEMRTPMNAIIGFSQMVLNREGENLSTKQQQNLSRVTDSANHLLVMVNDMLDLSKIEAGRMDVKPERFMLNELIVSCCEAIEPLLGDDVVLEHQVDPSVVEVQTDPQKLRQILTNLLSNAAKFTRQGTISVAATQEKDQIVISVVDTGIGIPSSDLDFIFEEFKQVEQNADVKGTGLGLPITRAMTHLLGGSVDVRSEPQKGSTFTVSIPANYTEASAIQTDEMTPALAN